MTCCCLSNISYEVSEFAFVFELEDKFELLLFFWALGGPCEISKIIKILHEKGGMISILNSRTLYSWNLIVLVFCCCALDFDFFLFLSLPGAGCCWWTGNAGLEVVVKAGEEHANVAPLPHDTEDGDAIELKGDKLEVEEPKDNGLGAVVNMLAFGATTTVTIPAWAAAVSSISDPVCRNNSVPPSVTMAWIEWPEGGDMSPLNAELESRGDWASELWESSSIIM